MQNNPPLVFGPVNSRRFGISLGIDLSPNKKQCNFDCLYCELEKAKTVNIQDVSLDVNSYITAVQESLIKYPETQVITITANGEPTLYPYLNELVDNLNKIKKDKKLLILSNSSLIHDESIINILLKIDIVKLSMDCVSKDCFKKLDRLDKTINHNDILNGLVKFSKKFTKEFIIEVLFVDTINNNMNEIKKIYTILENLNPTRVDIGTIDRPPAYDVKPISYIELQDIASSMPNLNISIAHKSKTSLNKFLSKNEIINLLHKRPQTLEDIDNLLNNESRIIFNNLIKNNLIFEKNQAGVIFYGTRR